MYECAVEKKMKNESNESSLYIYLPIIYQSHKKFNKK